MSHTCLSAEIWGSLQRGLLGRRQGREKPKQIGARALLLLSTYPPSTASGQALRQADLGSNTALPSFAHYLPEVV